jgi:hypothetical protein
MQPQAVLASGPCCCFSLFFLLMGGILAYFGMRQYFLVQKIANTPTSKVRSAAAGLVELFGKAVCKEGLSSPISKVRCVYWLISAEYYDTTGERSEWRTFMTRKSDSRFFLEDDTGKMLVDPKMAQFNIPADFRSAGHLGQKGFLGAPQNQLDSRVLAWIEADASAKVAFGNMGHHELRVTESYIAEGDPLFVLGSAEPIPGSASAIKSENLVVGRNNIDKILFIADSEEKKFKGTMGIVSWVMTAVGLLFLTAALLGILFSLFSLVAGA